MKHYVNGRDWNEVLESLKSAVPKKGDVMDFSYIPIKEFIRLLDSNIGVSNYTVEYSDLKYISIKSGQDLLSVKCRLTIIDDEGEHFIFKEGLGGSEYSYSAKNNGRDVTCKNSPIYAQQSAFKSAAKALGCFYLSEYSNEGGNEQSSDRRSEPSKPRKGVDILKVDSCGAFYIVDGSGDMPTYKLPVKIKGEQCKSELIFYPNNYGKVSQKLNRLIVKVKEGSVYIKPSVRQCKDWNGVKQYVFLGFND